MNEATVKNKEPILVIGFPKSGNTWLARMLAEATASKINAGNPIDDADNSLTRTGMYLVYKLHDRGDMVLPRNARIVYVVRDIRDVLVSAFFFNNRFICEDWVKLVGNWHGMRVLARIYFRHQIRRMNQHWCGNEYSGLRNLVCRKKNTIGDWSSHILLWTKHPDALVVRYEDLLRDTEGELKKILRGLSIEVDDKTLKETIENQSFEKKKAKFFTSGDSRNSQFMRSGRAGGWRDFLSPSILKRIESTHGSVMSEYGYVLESNKGEI